MNPSPRLLLTMGDVAGIGPEVIARAWPALHDFCRPVVVGDPAWLRRALRLAGTAAEGVPGQRPHEVLPPRRGVGEDPPARSDAGAAAGAATAAGRGGTEPARG